MKYLIRFHGRKSNSANTLIDAWNDDSFCRELAIASKPDQSSASRVSYEVPISDIAMVLTGIGTGLAANILYDAIKRVLGKAKASNIGITQITQNQTVVTINFISKEDTNQADKSA